MNIITHALIGWCAGQKFSRKINEVAVITAASIIPDLDGLGAIVDLVRGGEAELFSEYHHKLGHCLPFAILLTLAVYFFSRKNARLALWCAVIFHLHLFCDIVGARGPDGFQWPIHYFYPFSDAGFVWSGQWLINAWPNLLLTVVLLVVFLYQSARSGFSPLQFISARADALFVATLQKRFGLTGGNGNDNH